MEKINREKMIHALEVSWTTRKTNKGILDQIKHELSLEAKMTTEAICFFLTYTKIRLQTQWKKTIMLWKLEGSRKRDGSNTRWIDPARPVTGKILLRSLIHRIAITVKQLGVNICCISPRIAMCTIVGFLCTSYSLLLNVMGHWIIPAQAHPYVSYHILQ